MELKQLSDNELIAEYRGGNSLAISQLIERHTLRVRNYIRMLVKDREVADDIFQETFIKAVKSIDEGRYAESGRFLSWLMRIAHNLTIDYFRVKKADKELNESEAGFDIVSSVPLAEQSLEDKMVRDQIDQDIRNLIDELPGEQREVVKMRYFSGLTFKDIAEQTDVSVNTALGRMRYALINLRRMIKERELTLS
ncbi:MAG: sigma-70 family RNA polymerase sigma factor [Rikenellaceae bacterium]